MCRGETSLLPPSRSAARSLRCANVPTPGAKTSTPLNVANAPPFTVTSCNVNVTGTICTYAGETITKYCQLTATLNVLPIMVTATVTLAGNPAIDGKTMNVYYVCK